MKISRLNQMKWRSVAAFAPSATNALLVAALIGAFLSLGVAPSPAQPDEARSPDHSEKPRPADAPVSKGGGEPGGRPPGRGGQGPPPAAVTIGEVVEGALAPDAEFLGTIFFTAVSDVASEVSGKVVEAAFEEGQRLSKGDVLVRLDVELQEKSLAGLEAGLAQMQVEVEESQVNYEREKSLFKQTVGVERNYDQARFQVQILTRKLAQQQALIARLSAEIRKHQIRVPFDGVVLKRHVEAGEWLNPGGLVAVVAAEHQVDAIVNLPARVLPFLETNAPVPVVVNGKSVTGRLFTVVPRGEVATRTFPVKIRIESAEGLYEGMEARVRLPVAEQRECLLVDRDTIIPMQGQDTVFTVTTDNTAASHPVRVLGFRGPMAGVESKSLKPGDQAITKGQERLRTGQPVTILRGEPNSTSATRGSTTEDHPGGRDTGRRP